MHIAKLLILMLFCVPAFLGCRGEEGTQDSIIEAPAEDPAVTTDPVDDPAIVEDEPADPVIDDDAVDDDQD